MATKKPATPKTSPKPPAKTTPKKRAPRKKAPPKGATTRNTKRATGQPVAEVIKNNPAWAKGLNPDERSFLEHYATNGFNGRKAWEDSRGACAGSRTLAWRLLTQVHIKAALKALLQEIHMTTDELREMVADDARASMDDFLVVDAEGNATLDLTAAAQNGALRHIKKLTVETTRDGGQKLQVELVDRQRARDSLAKLMGAHTQRVEITGKDGGAIEQNVNVLDRRKVEAAAPDEVDDLFTSLTDADEHD